MMYRIMAALFARMQTAYYKRRYQIYRNLYDIDPSFFFNGIDIRFYGDGKLNIGKNSYIGSYSTIELTKDYIVSIGENCQISHNVRMYTSSADPNQDFTKSKIKPSVKGSIIIGNGVWIGANVFINPGVTIGDNAVIGANAVVTKDIEAMSIVGGVPAKLIRFKDHF